MPPELNDDHVALICAVLHQHRVAFALEENAVTIEVGPVGVRIAALSDIVASKRAAGRPKDIVALPLLEARLRELGESKE